MSIPSSFIQELLARVDVVEVVGRHVQLKKGGANYMGLCPFHGEKSPSFSVSPSKQFFHCFGCGKSGNAIGFLMEHVGMGFVEAVQELAQQTGLQVPREDLNPMQRLQAQRQRQQQQTLNQVLEKAGEAFRQHLRNSPEAIAYLQGRGVSGTTASRFGLGYAPPGWSMLAGVFPDYTSPLLEASGLVVVGEADGKRYDRFRHRIMFPIRNVKGECIGFGGRVLGNEKPKYLNSPETPVFHKGSELYGLYEARQAIRESGYALVTEGYMDVVMLAQQGLAHCVATLGTACTPEHVRKLFRFTDQVVFSFDGDAAGQRAAHKALEAALPFASDTRSVKFLFLPPEHDPDSYIRSHGPQGFTRLVEQALPLSQFLLDVASHACDITSAEGRARMLSKAQPLWAALPAGALKTQLLNALSVAGQLPLQALQQLWAGAGVSGEGAGALGVVPGAAVAGPLQALGPLGEGGALAPSPQAGLGSASGRYGAGRPWSDGPPGERGGRWRRRDAALPMQPPMPTARANPRAQQAARLLLSHMSFFELLTQDDVAALCAMPPPYGPLFVWLEAQWLAQGPQSWALLREQLAGHPCQAVAEQAMHGPHGQIEGEEVELRGELRDLLNRMLIDNIKEEQNHLIHAIGSDPAALARYRQLQAQRQRLGG